MDLLNMLSGLMTDSSSIDALSQKAGTDSTQTKGIVETALPMLVGALKNNASSESGAASLLGALKQHTNTASIKDQIANADAEDGGKIIQHILGDDQISVLQSISDKTGAETSQISSLLSNLAPGLMSSLFAATSASGSKKSSEQSDGLGLTSLLGLFGGGDSKSESSGGLGSLLGGLFGGGSKDEDSSSESPLMGVLKSFLK
ncbi:MAG: DUF937 domain-containing protein [Parasporobacterium sp.]|nr:DUF937 domain-containing protein [Parasporobacterium sp.]